MADNDYPDIYDVIIIGAGPCGLATAARLREEHPSALFTDEEQARYAWINRHARRAAIKDRRNGKTKPCTNAAHRDRSMQSVLVLDRDGSEWMTRWNRLFAALEIQHLRSPMFFHLDPSDRDSLLAFMHEQGRAGEMFEIGGCVGKEISKHQNKKKKRKAPGHAKAAIEVNERDRRDYFSPSTGCFRDFCESCKARYGLHEHQIRCEAAEDIQYGVFNDVSDHEHLFRVETETSRAHFARFVVLAVGHGQLIPPKPFPMFIPEGASHATDFEAGNLLSKRLQDKIKRREHVYVLIIGGGLTSAQLADLLVRRGVDRVHLLMRGAFKVKPFDVDLSWMSKFRNHQRAAFWSADDFQERLEMVQTARNGGSITPEFKHILREHTQSGRLEIHCHTVVETQSFSRSSGLWTISTSPQVDNLPQFDHIYFATTAQIDVNNLPCLQQLMQSHPIKTYAGLPELDSDLKWRSDVPLFVTGKLATLQLGPGAGNLEGARLGAERVAWAIEEMQSHHNESDSREDEDFSTRYAVGVGSKFASLSM